MKINKKNYFTHKTLAVVAVLLVLATVAVGLVLYWQSKQASNTDTTINNEPPTKEQVEAGEDAKNNAIKNDEKSNIGTTNPEQGSSPVALSVTITAVNQDGSTVRIRNLIDKLVNGTCVITLKNGNQTISKQSNIQALANSSTCAGFDIPDLTPGTWNIELVVTSSDGATGTAVRSIDVK